VLKQSSGVVLSTNPKNVKEWTNDCLSTIKAITSLPPLCKLRAAKHGEKK